MTMPFADSTPVNNHWLRNQLWLQAGNGPCFCLAPLALPPRGWCGGLPQTVSEPQPAMSILERGAAWKFTATNCCVLIGLGSLHRCIFRGTIIWSRFWQMKCPNYLRDFGLSWTYTDTHCCITPTVKQHVWSPRWSVACGGRSNLSVVWQQTWPISSNPRFLKKCWPILIS
jgi:hypothetical protein